MVWKTEREELPSWGTPTVAETPDGPVLVTNASNFIRGYDPRTGRSCGGSAAARRSRRRRRFSPTICSSSPAAVRPSVRSSRSGRRLAAI